MSKLLKFRWLAVKILLVIAFVAFCITISGLTYGDYREVNVLNAEANAETIILELEIGEEYDLSDALSAAKKKINKELFKNIDGSLELYAYRYSKSIILQGTTIKAINCGVGRISYVYDYTTTTIHTYDGSSNQSITLLEVIVVVQDDEANWIPVYNIEDIGGENKTYILKNDIVISGEYEKSYITHFFTGMLINPDGYTITFAESTNLSKLFYANMGLVDGLIIKYNSSENFMSISGLMIALANESIITNCDIEMNVEASRINVSTGSFYNNTVSGTFTLIEGEDLSFYFNLWETTTNNTFNLTIKGDTSNLNIQEESFGNNEVNITILEDEED